MRPAKAKLPASLSAVLAIASVAAVLALGLEVPAQVGKGAKLDVAYEPTPQPVVDLMLKIANVTASDYVIDLGCGDGRIPVAAAKRHGARALCVDLDPKRVKEARANIEKHGVGEKVEVVEGDLFKTDLSKATVITMFLWDTINLKLRPKLLELKPGTRIVSHEHKMGDWAPDKAARHGANEVWLWVIPARIAGAWSLSKGQETIALALMQRYQRFEGRAEAAGKEWRVRNGRIVGAGVSFELAGADGKSRAFTGRLGDDATLVGDGWGAKRRP